MAEDNFMLELLSKNEKEYGNDYQNHLFGQYKLYVQSIEKTSDRRQYANIYFLTINTALISLVGLLFKVKIFESAN